MTSARRLVIVAVVGGFLLRIPTILWGLPRLFFVHGYHPDEPILFASIYDFPSNYLVNRTYDFGTAWTYMIGLLLFPLKSWLRDAAYYRLVTLTARSFSVAAGTLAVYLTWRLGERLFGRRAGVIAAALLSVSLYHCSDSAFAKLDVPMSCLLLLLLLATMHAVDAGRLSAWALCGLVAGVLMGTKVVAVIFALAPLVVIAVVVRPQTFRAMALYMAVASVVLFVSTPHMFVHAGDFWKFMQWQKTQWYDAYQAPPLLERLRAALGNIQIATGPLLIVAFLGGAVLSLRRMTVVAAAALFVIVLYYAFWGGFLVPRYVIATVPVLCLFAGVFYAALLDSPHMAIRGGGVALLAVALALSLYDCGAGIAMRLNDTRPRAERFIAALPPGTSIAIGSVHDMKWRLFDWREPFVDFRKHHLLSVLDRPSFIVLTSLDAEEIERARRAPKRDSPPLLAFYDELHSTHSAYRLIAGFRTPQRVPIEFPPPEIWIYQLR